MLHKLLWASGILVKYFSEIFVIDNLNIIHRPFLSFQIPVAKYMKKFTMRMEIQSTNSITMKRKQL